MGEIKKVLEVTEVTLRPQDIAPPNLRISAKGKVATSGWSKPQLIQYVYVTPPSDGIWEFDFVAEAPPEDAIVTQAVEDLKEDAVYNWKNFPEDDVKGIRVYSSTNSIEKIINE